MDDLLADDCFGDLIRHAFACSLVVVDPMTQSQASIIGQLNFLVGLWFYFRWNGHLLMVRSVVESLRLVPLGRLALFPAGDMSLGTWLQELLGRAR